MKNRSLAQIILSVLLLAVSSRCRATVSSAITTPTPSNTAIPTSTLKPTSTSTPTETPTEIPTPIMEKDLQPVYVETIAQAYKDVEVSLSIITDTTLNSANPSINRIYLNPRFNNYLGENSKDALAHFTALTFYKLWLSRQGTNQSTSNTDFESYLKLWSQAQKSNNPKDWEKVEITRIWANDLNDGNGYKQQEFTIWPMYTGDPGQIPQGVRAITEFSIAFVRAVKMNNITMFQESNAGYGFNLDGSIFYVYMPAGGGPNAGGWNLTSLFSFLVRLILKNDSGSILYSGGGDMELYKLVNRSSNIGSCCYQAVLKIDPPTRYENIYNP